MDCIWNRKKKNNFLVSEIEFDEEGLCFWAAPIEAVMRQTFPEQIHGQVWKDPTHWLQGWK